MIAIARKNLSCLVLNPNSFLCNSNLHFLPPIHFFSTSTINRLTPSAEIHDVLVNKHQFLPELASRLPKFRDPQRADSVLSFLKENSFTTTQLQKLIMYDPRILGFTIEGLESKFKVFQNLGLSSEEIAKMISSNKVILHSSMANKIIPNLSMLKGLLGSNDDVARLLKRCSWFVVYDLEKTLIPNVEILKRFSIPMERILHLLYGLPRAFLVKSDIMRRSVDKAIEFGVPRTSVVFIYAVGLFHFTSQGMWEVKLQTLRDLGFSDDDVLAMLRKQPTVFRMSGNTMKSKVELLLATGKYGVASIVANPVALCGSIEKRLEPRVQILRLLESRNLIEKWPSLSSIATFTDGIFIDRFIRPYYDVIGEEHIANMTPIFPKHFAYLLSRNSPFLCKSRVPFSTSTAKNPKINPTVYNFLFHEHNFSPESAAEAASVVSGLRNRQKSDSLFSYLEKNGFSSSHLETLVKYNPSFISADLEKTIKPKIELFQELGLSNDDIADLVTDNASILFRSTDKVVIPALSLLRSLLGSDASVVNLLKRSGWFLIKDLDKSMVPNIEFLKGRGVPTEKIIACMHSFARTLLQNPGKLRRAADRVEELGARPGSGMYIHAVRVIASMSDEVWEAKLGAFRELGFSDEEIVNGFSKYPPAFAVSLRKMREVTDVVVATGKYGMASIVAYPICFCGSVEKRLRPRIRVLAALEEKMLIKKWPSLATLCSLSDVRFFERFVKPYFDEVGHLFRDLIIENFS